MSHQDIQQVTERVKESAVFLEPLYAELGKAIIGQRSILENLLIALLADGHVLMEGLPGLAKTTAIKSLAAAVDAEFSRIQFTPDLLPADIIGTQIYEPKTGEFRIKKGPIFSNFVLTDEINRAPAKVQSALLETMEERQVTIGGETFKLEVPFLVLATQNPIEQEGTYSLPEAQTDRFLLKIRVDYPSESEEVQIIEQAGLPKFEQRKHHIQPVLSKSALLDAREVVERIYVDKALMEYMVRIVFATRTPEDYGVSKLKDFLSCGASPRASIALLKCAKAHAYLNQRGFVTPQDIKSVCASVLRHRLIVSYEAEAENVSVESIIQTILQTIPTP